MDSSVEEDVTEEDETDYEEGEETLTEGASFNEEEDDDKDNRDLTASPAAPMEWGSK
jgi:hypothetical protein